MKSIRKILIKTGLPVILVLSVVLGMGMPVAEASTDNQVVATFDTSYWYMTDADSVVNILLPGTNKSTANVLINIPDTTGGESVMEPVATYYPAAGLSIGFLFPLYLIPGGPPYVWQFPDLPENNLNLSSAGAIVGDPFDFTPGFSANRNFSQTEFTGPGTQVIDITATPEETMTQLAFRVQVINDNRVNATITSVSGDGDPTIFPGGKFMKAVVNYPEVGTSCSVQVTLTVSPNPDVITATYKPNTSVFATHETASGSDSTSELNKTLELGTWSVVTTPESYLWNWHVNQNYGITFQELNKIEGYNQIYLSIGSNYGYRAGGDSVPNIASQSAPWISSNLHNGGDNTGASIVSPVLELDALVTVTGVWQNYLVPGSEYTWEFPNIPENHGIGGGANVVGMVEFTTGFSASRIFDQTVFPPAGGTQILTIEVMPEEIVERLDIHVNLDFGMFSGIATVTSATGQNVGIDPGGHWFHARIDAPVAGQTYQWQVTITINPLPPDVAALEYRPQVGIAHNHSLNSGIYVGNSMSGNAWSLDGGSLLGTFTWQADGEYSWYWEEITSKQVNWDGTARYIYPPPAQEEINQAIEDAIAWVRSQQDPETGAWYWGRPQLGPYQPEEPEVPNVGMTGFAVWSLLHGLVPQTDPQVQAGIQYILSQQELNPMSMEYGSFGQRGRTYETGLAILALRATNNPAYLDEMALAVQYLINSQNDENKSYSGYPVPFTNDDWAYGGWDYNYNSVFTSIWTPEGPQPCDPYVRADMSNSQFAIIGLKAAQEAGIDIDPAVWGKAQIFIGHCQMTDGGFGYQPAIMGHSSMGTITAGCVWSLRLMDVPVEDQVVQSGLDWLDSHPFDGTNPAGAYRNWFLWSAAKAFTLCGRSPILEQGTWYSDYARYLVDCQEADGSWLNPAWPNGESNLNATTCGLLVLEKAVLPPPPGIEYVTVDRMMVQFDPRPDRDKIKIFEARFQLNPEVSYNLDTDDVTVTVDGVSVTIPAGSFDRKGKKESYQYNSSEGSDPKIKMEIDFDSGAWSLMVDDIDATVINNDDGVVVTLMIGYMLAGQNVPMWVDRLVYPPHP